MPTSVLLAVLAAAGLLALAPALVRRYDATERLVAERALSTARVLTRVGGGPPLVGVRRRRTIPGRRPINPPRVLARQVAAAAAFAAGAAVYALSSSGPAAPAAAPTPASAPPTAAAPPRRRRSTAYRRRRTLLLLALALAAEITGVCVVAPGFWVPLSVTAFLFVAYVVHLRNRALVEQRRRRAEARYERWVRARQAAVRREQERRAAARRELLERQLAAREEERRQLLRGRSYEVRAAGQ